MAKEYNRPKTTTGRGGGSDLSKSGRLKNVKKEYNRILAHQLGAMQEGASTGETFQQFQAGVAPTVGSAVGDVQRGQAQAALATTGTYSGYQQEAARKAQDAGAAQTAGILGQYKQQQQAAAQARQQTVLSGLQYERAQRKAARESALQTMKSIADIIYTQGSTLAQPMAAYMGGSIGSAPGGGGVTGGTEPAGDTTMAGGAGTTAGGTAAAGGSATPVSSAATGAEGIQFADASALAVWSDVRLKENIESIGASPSGIPLYLFNYKHDPDTRYQGTMAQDLMDTHPDAVHRGADGYLSVDYSRIDIDFKVG